MDLKRNKSSVRFSVVIPVYNTADFLEACLESVVRQTCQDFEIILVDDGSSDASAAICDRYVSEKVVVHHQRNQGHTLARKKGSELSSGDYIVFLDSDDVLDPTFLEKVCLALGKAPADLVQCGMQTFPGDKDTLRLWGAALPDGYYNQERIRQEVFPCLMMAPNGACFPRSLCAKAIRRDIVLRHIVLVPPQIRTGEDMCCVISMFKDIRSLSVCSDALYLYRMVPGSVSKSADPEALARCVYTLRFLNQLVPICEASLYPQYLRLGVQQVYSACLRTLRSDGRRQIRRIYNSFLKQTAFRDIVIGARFSNRELILKRWLLLLKLFCLIQLIDRLRDRG